MSLARHAGNYSHATSCLGKVCGTSEWPVIRAMPPAATITVITLKRLRAVVPRHGSSVIVSGCCMYVLKSQGLDMCVW